MSFYSHQPKKNIYFETITLFFFFDKALDRTSTALCLLFFTSKSQQIKKINDEALFVYVLSLTNREAFGIE